MKLTFLGTGAAYYPVLGSTSAFFTLGKTLYLIDCGETTFARLFGRGELAACEEVYVLITHLHADHFGSLGSFISYCKNVLHKRVTLLTPDTTINHVMILTGLTREDYDHVSSFGGAFPGGLRITPVLVRHDASMSCYGYYLSDGTETVYYGGDACGMPEGVLAQLESGEIARVYQEVTYEAGHSPSHTSLEQLCALVPAHLRSRIIGMHFGGDFEDRVEACGFIAARPV